MTLDKCECYHVQKYINPPKSTLKDNKILTTYGNIVSVGECWGTKEREHCTCGGDINKCDFYPEKREENKKMEENKTLTTAEMWLKAQEDGRTYRYGDLIYNRNTGFINNLGEEWENLEETLSEFMEIDEWEEENTVMTKTQAEEKFGITILGD